MDEVLPLDTSKNCFGAARDMCTDPSMIARAEDGVRKSWTAWIEHIPLDMLSDLKGLIDQRMTGQDDCSEMSMKHPGNFELGRDGWVEEKSSFVEQCKPGHKDIEPGR